MSCACAAPLDDAEVHLVNGQDCMQDVELIFSNCLLYNGNRSEVGMYGERLNELWRHQWATSGLGGADACFDQRLQKRLHCMIGYRPSDPGLPYLYDYLYVQTHALCPRMPCWYVLGCMG
jgi:hypothetical protein